MFDLIRIESLLTESSLNNNNYKHFCPMIWDLLQINVLYLITIFNNYEPCEIATIQRSIRYKVGRLQCSGVKTNVYTCRASARRDLRPSH